LTEQAFQHDLQARRCGPLGSRIAALFLTARDCKRGSRLLIAEMPGPAA
jgi:hypothetical protein